MSFPIHRGIVFTANMKYLCIPNVGCLCYLKVPAVVLEIVEPEIIVMILLLKYFIYVY